MEQKTSIMQCHQYFSAENFNKCWELMDKENRSKEENEEMILLTLTSLWHWKNRDDVNNENLSIAYWQAAKVYANLEKIEEAVYYADRCLELSLNDSVAAFFVGYAYEVLAQVMILKKDYHKAKEYINLGKEQLKKIEEKENADYLEADLMLLEDNLKK